MSVASIVVLLGLLSPDRAAAWGVLPQWLCQDALVSGDAGRGDHAIAVPVAPDGSIGPDGVAGAVDRSGHSDAPARRRPPLDDAFLERLHELLASTPSGGANDPFASVAVVPLPPSGAALAVALGTLGLLKWSRRFSRSKGRGSG